MAMVKTKEMNTICAISTPYGSGGIAVIRVSGESAIQIADSLFHGRKSLEQGLLDIQTAVTGYLYHVLSRKRMRGTEYAD